MSRASRAAIALAVIVALLFTISAMSLAAKKKHMARPAAIGAGAMPSASASNTGDVAWIYTGNFRNTAPDQITGSIKVSAKKGATISQDRADATAQFMYQDSKYMVHVTCPFPISGQTFPGHGPVQFMRSVLGANDLGTLDLPQTHAHVGIFARSTISRDGKVIADNQPTIVLVNEAIHSSDQQYLSSPATDRTEITLIVPGPLSGQKFVKSFANGAFYIYWPDVKTSLSDNITPTPTPANIPTRSGRGPARPMVGTTAPRGTIDISLTDTGITKQIGQTETGLYDLNITNNSSRPRGLVMTGVDLCCTSYTRFSQILRPGASQVLTWYFAPGKVLFKDFFGGTRTSTGYRHVKLAGHSSSLVFN